MKSLELERHEMIQVVEQNIKQINATIYNEVIKKKVADKVEDKALADQAVKNLEKLEKTKDGYAEILKELEKGNGRKAVSQSDKTEN